MKKWPDDKVGADVICGVFFFVEVTVEQHRWFLSGWVSGNVQMFQEEVPCKNSFTILESFFVFFSDG